MIERVVSEWKSFVRGELPDGLAQLLDEDVVFYSPIVFTPQRGKEVASLYLAAAARTFGGERNPATTQPGHIDGSFRYTKTVLGGDTAVLEFETTMEGKYVNGVDIIQCNERAKIIEFRVMIRPLQAVNLVHQQMAAMLETMRR
jgi:hypothetical protein